MNETDDNIWIIGNKIDETKTMLGVLIFLLFVTIVKLGYFWGHRMTQYIPESSLLLFVGIVFGYVLKKTYGSIKGFEINSDIFMYLLLPPIVLESAFAMYHTDFMANILGVLIFAIIATILNFIFLSLFLWILLTLDVLEESINVISILIFCALITSIDPVAVLAIFQQIQVDSNLYYLVFGESLLNDGVSVVLYNVLIQLASVQVWGGMHYFKAFVAFFAVAIGGGIVGTFISVITCVISRYTAKSPLSEPIIVFGMSMLAYLVAEMLAWSVIISMIMYGVTQVAYNFENLTHKSLILIKRLAKILANLSESIIFLSLGVTLFGTDKLQWNSSFSLWSLFLCIYVRFVITFLLSAFINHYRLTVRRLEWNEQYLLAYGGMRGGIGYCLSILLPNKHNIDKKSITDATIFIIIFTVVGMGMTMKTLVSLLDIKVAKCDELSLFDQINESVLIHTLTSIEAIIDEKGRYSFYQFSNNVSILFVKKYLQRNPVNYESKLMETYKAIDLKLYMANAVGVGTDLSLQYMRRLKPHLRADIRLKTLSSSASSHSLDALKDKTVYIRRLKTLIEDESLSAIDIFNMNTLIALYNKEKGRMEYQMKSSSVELKKKSESDIDGDLDVNYWKTMFQ